VLPPSPENINKLKMKFEKKKGDRIIPPAKTHVARLLRVVDLGTTYSEKYNSSNRYIDLCWELTATNHVFNEEIGEQPFVVSRKVTQNIGPKSTFGKMIKSWTGEDVPEEFDIEELFEIPCMISVLHADVTKDGDVTTYANVDTVVGVPDGMEVPELRNDPFIFDIDGFDQETFDSLPEFMREIIASSDEYKEMKTPKPAEKKSLKKSQPVSSGKKPDFLKD